MIYSAAEWSSLRPQAASAKAEIRAGDANLRILGIHDAKEWYQRFPHACTTALLPQTEVALGATGVQHKMIIGR